MIKGITWTFEPLNVGDYLAVEDGLIRIKGRRIGIEDVVRYFEEGYAPEEISRALLNLDLKIVYGLIADYLHHREAIDAYMVELDNETAQERAEWTRTRTAPSRKVESVLRERGIYRG